MITIDDFKANTKEWLIDKLGNMSFSDASQTISNLYNELHKPKYPKTYKECCDVLGIDTMNNNVEGYRCDLVLLFQGLLIARDAYWKIAGEVMGLDKPWKPDWRDVKQLKFGIHTVENQIRRITLHVLKNLILVFPTEEIRDAFYENFKEWIEYCKKLL